MPFQYLDEEKPKSSKFQYLDESPEVAATFPPPPTPPQMADAGNSNAFLPNAPAIQAATAERPNPWQGAKEALQKPFTPMTPFQILGAPFQAAEAAVANPALDVQAGRTDPMTLMNSVVQGATGQRSGELGDVIRTTGVGGKFNEPLAMGVGLGASTPVVAGVTKAMGKIGSIPAKLAAEMQAKYGVSEQELRKLSGWFAGKKRQDYLKTATRTVEDAAITKKTQLETRADEIKSGTQTKLSELEQRQLTEESARALQEQQLLEREAAASQQYHDAQFNLRTAHTKEGTAAFQRRQALDQQTKQIEVSLTTASRKTLPELRKVGKSLYTKQSKAYEAGVEQWMQSAEANQLQIGRNEMLNYLTDRNPHRPDDVQALMRDMFPEGTDTQALTPKAIYQHIENASRGVSRTVKETGNATWSTHLSNEKKWALLDLAEQKGAKGVVEAKSRYASWAPTRKRLINDVGIFRSNTEELDRGTRFLVRSAKQPQSDPGAFLNKVEEMAGVNFSDELRGIASQLDGVQREKAALQIRRVLLQEERVAATEVLKQAKDRAVGEIRVRREGLTQEGGAAKTRYAQERADATLGEQRALADVQREKVAQSDSTLTEHRRIEDVKSELIRRVRDRQIKTALAGIILDVATGRHVINAGVRAAAAAVHQ